MISHIPARMSPALREGIITASVTREYPHVIASTGSTRAPLAPTGIGTGGNHRSHWASSPGAYSRRSVGSGGRHDKAAVRWSTASDGVLG